jgi:tetratricopeptide (TPR) repeat protein
MRRVTWAVLVLMWAATSSGTQFQRFLSPDRPDDRAIMNYMALEQAGKATSMDLTNMAVLILDKGFPTDAEKVLKAALKLDKHNYEASYRLGLVLQRMGRDGEAVRAYKRCLRQRPGYAQARFMLALAEERCGKRDAAIRDYTRAFRHAPELANPAKNPLVYDSDLQLAATMRYYEEQVNSMTLRVTVPDPGAVHRMSEVPLPTPTAPPIPPAKKPVPTPKP